MIFYILISVCPLSFLISIQREQIDLVSEQYLIKRHVSNQIQKSKIIEGNRMSNSLILGKYKNLKKLGKGAYGQVLLVEDMMGQKFALKMISLKSLQKEQFMLEYLESEIQCMMTMHSKYIMKLVESQEDQKYKYMVCEYCDGGDLLSYQAKQKDQVFTLQRSTQIMSQVINGLEDLHREQYLHRDIKSTNILIKNQNGKELFKLADFGFSKKSSDVAGTVLGTQHYMSPQIYLGENYGFQVDMWAFGVLFFFMLNKQFPFKTNALLSPQRKYTELAKVSRNFSYQKAVQNTKKKLKDNCKPQVEDLFKRIFEVQVSKRISFFQIRKHPIFSAHFPLLEQSSQILYSKVFHIKAARESKLLKRQSLAMDTSFKSDTKRYSGLGTEKTKNILRQKLHDTKQNIEQIYKRGSSVLVNKTNKKQENKKQEDEDEEKTIEDQNQNKQQKTGQGNDKNSNRLFSGRNQQSSLGEDQSEIIVSHKVYRKQNIEFPKQSNVLYREIDKLQFLYECGIQFLNSTILTNTQRLNLGFHVIKLYIISLRNLIENASEVKLKQKFPKLKWSKYCMTEQYIQLIKNECEDLSQAEMKFEFVYEECEHQLPQIMKINEYFVEGFDSQIDQKRLEGKFKLSYKKATHFAFTRLRQVLLQLTQKKQNCDIRLHYTMALIVVCHIFNHIFENAQKFKKIFGNYLVEKKRTVQTVDFSELHEWITKTSSINLNKITTSVIELYFDQQHNK